MSVASPAFQLTSPFPGLRPFERHEAAIFFGRHDQISEMLRRMEAQRFLAVVGASGCGKSSLVRAGLLPALEEGFLFSAGSDWRMAILRPGDDPYRELAGALCEALPVSVADNPDDQQGFVQARLRSGAHGLIQTVHDAVLPADTNVLVLVDQFEELFRFRHARRGEGIDNAEHHRAQYQERNTANAFVNLLLETIRRQADPAPAEEIVDVTDTEDFEAIRRQTDPKQSEVPRERAATPIPRPKCPIFIILTMRSEFLGDCDAFLGLPEAISQSQFLTPRMNREQLADTIIRPLEVFGSTAEPGLLNRILNDVGSSQDALPLMQHALLRTWIEGKQRCTREPRNGDHQIRLTIRDYEKAGGFEAALSQHAKEVYDQLGCDPKLGPRYQQVAELLFRALCRQTSDGVLLRNPIRMSQATAIADASETELLHVAEVFRQEGRHFLMASPSDQPLAADSTLDISHECLLRQWQQLHTWLEREAESAAMFRRLLDAARRHAVGKAALWGAPDLDLAIEWREKEHPNAAWAERYGGDFDLVKRFIKDSEAARAKSVAWKTFGIIGLTLSVLALLWLFVFYLLPRITLLQESTPTEFELLLAVGVLGAFGAGVRVIRSVVSFVGNRRLGTEWMPYYLLLPVQGAALGVISYLLIRSTLVESKGINLNIYTISAVAFLMGWFTPNVTDKLREVFETLLKTEEKTNPPQNRV